MKVYSFFIGNMESQKAVDRKLNIQFIRRDGGTQIRVAINQAIVEEYAELMRTGTLFPPVIVFFDGWDYWLSDGYHRVLAAELIGLTEILTEVKEGTIRDALLYGCSANLNHGLRLSIRDKRRALKRLLIDSEWSQWSDREIARRCGVSAPMVSSVRNSICKTFTDTELNEQRKVQRGGKTYILNTANIGSKSITKASELKENDIVIVSSDHPPLSDGVIPGGMSGRVIFIPNPKNALVELAQGGCALLLTKYLNSNQPQQHLASSGADKQGERAVSTASACDKGASSLNLNDLISSLNALSDAELEKVGRAISQLQPHQVKIIMHSLAQSKELSVASLEAIASVNPDVVHQAIAVDCSKIM